MNHTTSYTAVVCVLLKSTALISTHSCPSRPLHNKNTTEHFTFRSIYTMAPTLFPASLLLLGLLVTQLKAQDPATISVWSLTTVTSTPEIASYFVKTKVTVQATNPGHGETGVSTWSTIYTTGSPYITSTMYVWLNTIWLSLTVEL